MYVYYTFSLSVGLVALIVFFILQWLHLPAGSLADWLIGIAIFYWLLGIVTIPWNIYFDAQEVIAEAAISKEKNIPVDPKQINYVKKVARWSIVVAILLHLISAVVLYLLAYFNITVLGYISSVAALLLTFFRPAIRAYQYLAIRLSMIREQIKYPREDVVELRGRVNNIEAQINKLNRESITHQQKAEELNQELQKLTRNLQQLISTNQGEHEQLLRESKNAISQLTEDSQFLGHIREIIRFIKNS
jgi:cell division protein FtsB